MPDVEMPSQEATRRWTRVLAESNHALRLIEEIRSQEAHDTLVDLLTMAYEQGYRDGNTEGYQEAHAERPAEGEVSEQHPRIHEVFKPQRLLTPEEYEAWQDGGIPEVAEVTIRYCEDCGGTGKEPRYTDPMGRPGPDHPCMMCDGRCVVYEVMRTRDASHADPSRPIYGKSEEAWDGLKGMEMEKIKQLIAEVHEDVERQIQGAEEAERRLYGELARRARERIQYLSAQINEIPTWGAAVGAMDEERRELQANLAVYARKARLCMSCRGGGKVGHNTHTGPLACPACKGTGLAPEST